MSGSQLGGRQDRGVAVVTGGGRNLGRAICLALAASGHDVVVAGHSDQAAVDAVAEEVRAYGVRAEAVLADVAKPHEVETMLSVAAGLGSVRVLVNNAAVRPRVPIDELSLEQWRAVHDVVLDGAFHCVHAALPHLRASGSGRIINLLGRNAIAGDPSRVHVVAAKHGLLGLTIALARACAEDGITVNAISPGKMNPRNSDESARRRGRLGETIAFLASAAGADVTGQVIEVGPLTDPE